MKRLVLAIAIMLVAASVLVAVAVGPAESAGANIKLRASTTSCKAKARVKFTATVTSKTKPYAVRLYKKVNGSWRRVATASQVSATRYVAYATSSRRGRVAFKAGFVNSAGRVRAYSNVIVVRFK